MYIYIRSMSEAQSKIYDRIADKAPQIVENICKLILFPNSDSQNHWMQEVYSFVNFVPKLKGKNKRPKPNFIKKCLSVANDSIDVLSRRAISNEQPLQPKEVDVTVLLACVQRYQDWLSNELSEFGAVDESQVKNALTELIRSVK